MHRNNEAKAYNEASFNNFAELLPGTVNHSLELVTQDISKFECSGTQPCIDSKL